MTINAVIFDFSGTLFRLEQDPRSWTDDNGAPLATEDAEELIRRMTTATGDKVGLTGEFLEAFERRDLDPALHRKAYLELLRLSGIADPTNATAIYESATHTGSWQPYPDTEKALKAVSAAGLALGVLSNTAFDIRPAFTERGLDAYVDSFVLSYEVGAIKPDPAIFELALRRLGIPAEQALMVGDSAEADGAATAVGCEFARVEPLALAERPDGLLNALRNHGLA